VSVFQCVSIFLAIFLLLPLEKPATLSEALHLLKRFSLVVAQACEPPQD
jgi:hypothetical protein